MIYRENTYAMANGLRLWLDIFIIKVALGFVMGGETAGGHQIEERLGNRKK